jgi:hypothetical protein
VSWEDPPTDEQEKTIGKLCRSLGIDVEIYYPIASRREARQLQYELLGLVKGRAIRQAAAKISRKIVDG